MSGELEERIIQQLNIETKEFSLAQHDKIIALEWFRNLCKEMWDEFPELPIPDEYDGLMNDLVDWFRKWSGRR